jgi:hypothetical protein
MTNKRGSAIVHITSNSSIVVAGNSSVSNLALPGETISGVTIKQAIWGNDDNTHKYIQINRGANTAGIYSGTGQLNYGNLPLSLDKEATVDFIGAATGIGYIILELGKELT